MTGAEVPACDRCGEHHREEGECAIPERAGLVERVRARWAARQARKRQRTFIYCPSCNFELVAGGEWLGQEVTTMYEAYRCARCDTTSVWDFDLFPVPVRVLRDPGEVTRG